MSFSKPKFRKLIKLLLREALSGATLERCPEPNVAMDDSENVQAFHEQGEGSLLPVYHFNALGIGRLLPEGGTVVDLGSGSGQFITYLARHRPDARIIGLDLSEGMVALGSSLIRQLRLDSRVKLKIGDMTRFRLLIPDEVDVVSSVFVLHHLPTPCDLETCFGELAAVHQLCGCAVWLFDHVRPRNPRTAKEFPEIFTPHASESFRRDSRNSLIASFSFEEMSSALDKSFGYGFNHTRSIILHLYQTHWMKGSRVETAITDRLWHGAPLPPHVLENYKRLRGILGSVPLSSW